MSLGASVATELRTFARDRSRHLALGAFACGVGSAASPPELRAAAAAVAVALPASLRAGSTGILCAGLFLVGGLAGGERLAAIDGAGRALPSDASLTARAHLLERPRPTRFGSRAEVRLLSGPGRGARLLARAARGARWPMGAGVGAELIVSGAVRRPRRRRTDRFDFAAYLRRRGVAAELWLSSVRATGRRRGGLQGSIDSMRMRAERALSAGVSPRAAALVRGMVLGQDDLIDEATRDDWRGSGLAHILAVSGQNVMLLAALALPLLSAVGLSPGTRIAVTVGLIALYVPLAGAGPSLQRAGVMGAASLVALGMARPASRWYVLLLAACATLLVNPRAYGDAGWQLSFAAVVGILVLAPLMRRALLRAVPHLLGEGVAITLAATLATAPLLAHHFGVVPVAGLPANVLALPLVAPIMWLGMLRAALGQLMSPGGGGVPLLGRGVSTVARLVNDGLGVALGPLIDGLNGLARAFADVPGGQVEWRPSAVVVGVAYVAILVGALVVVRLARHAEPSLTVVAAGWRRRPRRHRIAVVCAAGVLVALLLARATAPPDAPDLPTVSFLDVGQGDATLIQHPDGTAVLVDGGPPEGRVVKLLRRAGVRRLSAILMTHASRDHHGGLREVVERYPVDLLLDGGDGTRDRTFRATAAAAVRRGARRVPAIAPLTMHAGAVTIRVLSPAPRPPGPPPEDPNQRAVVAIVSIGEFDLLLSADAESPTLSGLRLPRVEAMKVPHHGSRDPGLGPVLERLRPAVASIPVGQNTYGHPAPSTLATLRSAGVSVHRTDREGTVRLTLEGRSLLVTTEREGPVVGKP